MNNKKVKTLFFIFSSILLTNIYGQEKRMAMDSAFKQQMPKKEMGTELNKKIESFLTIGVITGKIKDEKTQQGIANADIFVFVNKMDTATKTMKEKLLQKISTSVNGDFSVENLPVMQQVKLQFASSGYAEQTKKVGFKFNLKDMQSGGRDMTQLINATSVDVGTILLVPQDQKQSLEEVTLTSKKKSVLGVQVFNADQSVVSAGATAQELLKTIPMVNVDIEGNVTVRNASPQIYVDGKPSTLSLDQIPADLIERVEIMTNASAKFDAEGQGGILNIVLKRSKKLGVNGMLLLGSSLYTKPYRTALDLWQYNAGLILNIRKNKVNTFINAITFQRRMHGLGQTDRLFTQGQEMKKLVQDNINLGQGNMFILRGGLDYFVTNNSTLSADINYMGGAFTPWNELVQKFYAKDNIISTNTRLTQANNQFQNIRGSVGYKLTFPQQGKELTANLFYNIRKIDFVNTFTNEYINPAATNSYSPISKQQNHMISNADNYRLQVDYTNPISEEKKIEMGLNITYSTTPFNNQYGKINTDQSIINLSKTQYDYSDLNLAGYGTYTTSLKRNWTLQVGARIEQFYYAGTLYNRDNTKTDYLFTLPINIFPSIFVTKKINDSNTLQASYTLRVNRPSIFNLIPFTDYSDSTNLRKGDPNLKPEKIHVAEINYQYTTKNNYFLFALYGKYTDGVITQYQLVDSLTSGKNLLINTFVNSNYALTYGAEIVLKNTLAKGRLDFTTNFNVYNTSLNGGTSYAEIKGERWSFYAKETINLKLPLGFSFQTFIEYQHTTLVPPSSGNRSSASEQIGGRPAYLSSPNATSQGYIRPNFGVDIALKKEFLKGFITLTLAGTDVFLTKKYDAYTYSNAFAQNSWSTRNQSLYYLSANVRLGKMDVSVMKKKNMKAEKENMQGGGEAF